MNTSIEQEPVSSIHSGNPQVRVFFLLPFLFGVMLVVFLFLDGLSFLGPPKVHAQNILGVNCDNFDADLEADLEAIPRSPGADARYIVNFLNSEKELLPEQDGIVFRLDAQIGLPDKIKAGEIDIHYTKDPPEPDPPEPDPPEPDPPEPDPPEPDPPEPDPPEPEFGSGKASSVEVTKPSRRRGPATLTIYPKIVEDGKSKPIPDDAKVQVVIHEDAGLSNPIEGGAFQWEVGTTHDSETFCVARHPDPAVRNAFRRMEETIDDHVDEADLAGLLIDWEVELSKPTVRRGDQLEVTGRGFAVGTTVIFWRDSNMNGVFDALGAVLCRAESNAKAIARCSIPVTNPPLVPGFGDCTFELSNDYVQDDPIMVGEIDVDHGKSNCNFINARDGQGHSSILLLEEETDCPQTHEETDRCIRKKDNLEDAFQVLELTGSVDLGTLLPPYPTVRVELADFPQGHLESLALARIHRWTARGQRKGVKKLQAR